MNISAAYKLIHASGLYPPQLIQRTNTAIICEDLSLTSDTTIEKTLALLGSDFICRPLSKTKFSYTMVPQRTERDEELALKTLADYHFKAAVKIKAMLLVRDGDCDEVYNMLKNEIISLHKSIVKLILDK